MTSRPTKPINMIVAMFIANRGIGQSGKLPFKIAEDAKFFKMTTSQTISKNKQNAVVMGRKTWESLPNNFRPLTNRKNFVISSTLSLDERDAYITSSLESALTTIEEDDSIESSFICGGTQIYKAALDLGWVDRIYVTRVTGDGDGCDVFCPAIPSSYRAVYISPTRSNKTNSFDFAVYEPCPKSGDSENCPPPGPDYSEFLGTFAGGLGTRTLKPTRGHEEYQYLDLVQDIISHGQMQNDRTGVGTWSKFGVNLRFSLADEIFPLLTTKKVFWRGVVEELLWFLRGETSAKSLADRGVHIWDANGTRDFLDSRGLKGREEWDLGPIYGFQWRHFGADYVDMHTDYSGKGVDQLSQIIKQLKENPTDRRIILSAWNPAALHEMALPPCHVLCQFCVANGNQLTAILYQRSGDLGLGIPFNIASYALLTRMIAQVTGLEAFEFVHVIGNAHVYTNHKDQLLEQITREPRPFPILKISPKVKEISQFTFGDFSVVGYHPDPRKVEMAMAV